jgi:hypothetical protein
MKTYQLGAFFLSLSKTFLSVARAIESVQEFRAVLTQVTQQALREVAQTLQKPLLPALAKPVQPTADNLAGLFNGPGDGASQLLQGRIRGGFSAN